MSIIGEFYKRRAMRVATEPHRLSRIAVARVAELRATGAEPPYPIDRLGTVPPDVPLDKWLGTLARHIDRQLAAAPAASGLAVNSEASLAASTERVELEPGYSELVPHRRPTLIIDAAPASTSH